MGARSAEDPFGSVVRRMIANEEGSWGTRFRRLVAGRGLFMVCIVLACCGLFAIAAPAWGAYENVPTPTVEGPIPVTESSHPFLATDIPLSSYGYQRRRVLHLRHRLHLQHRRRDQRRRHEDHDRRPQQRRDVPVQDPHRRAPPDQPGELQRQGGRRVEQRHGRLRPRSQLVRRPLLLDQKRLCVCDRVGAERGRELPEEHVQQSPLRQPRSGPEPAMPSPTTSSAPRSRRCGGTAAGPNRSEASRRTSRK